MQTTSLLLGVLLMVGACAVRLASSSQYSAQQVLATLNLPNCDSTAKERLECVKLPFRTIDGTCNNLCNITRGAAKRPLQRFPELLKPTAFAEGFQPRRGKFGKILPNARRVSRTVFRNTSNNVNPAAINFTHATMTWGQFLDHDVTLTELTPNVECGVNNEPCLIRKGCIGIDIKPGDELASKQTAQCIPLRRSLIKDGEQVNIITSYIDASQVYGSEDELATRLRDPDNQKFLDSLPFIKSSRCNALLPPADAEAFCRSSNAARPCFIAGDIRVNENQALMAMHTLWVREHNRIASHLHKLNSPAWDDERVFQETRKIVAAEIQHITYKEWLAILFNKSVRDKARLTLEGDGLFFKEYDPTVNPEMLNCVATAAFRFGHTLVRDNFTIFSQPKLQTGSRLFVRGRIPTKEFFDPALLFRGEKINFIEEVLLGLAIDRAQEIDRNFVDSLRERLIIEDNIYGDLPAINIQRGRDHGLPGYIKFRQACGVGLFLAKSFFDLRDTISDEKIISLKQVYSDVSDIDLFAGGILESPAPGSLLGPTFTCLMTRQFKNLRFGDRFWYERDDPHAAFTLPRLTEIRKTSLARVICDNADTVLRIQKNAFQRPTNSGGSNPFVYCNELDKVNLEVFKEGTSGEVNSAVKA